MPRVIRYNPGWLQRPSPGHDVFVPSIRSPSKTTNGVGRENGPSKPSKTMATRGTELFVAIGNEIRWSDLVTLRENEPERSIRARRPGEDSSYQQEYRAIKVPVHGKIQQLVISPKGDLMAVVTTHTVHVVVLPDSSQLDSEDRTPIKPKTFQLGPTAHVLEQSPVASVLWHPLGYRGRCLVTITVDAVVRLWELNRSDRSTFNEPALAVDLQKLANATSDEEDFGASQYGASKGFSPDSVELEVVSACFGDFPEQEGVHGWAPMTLWIAMVEGDIYALCPLLPSKWQLDRSTSASTFMETLTTSINSNYALVQTDPEATPEELETAKKQLSWLSDLIYQEPLEEISPSGEPIDVYARPDSLPACPLLQGPFSMTTELEGDAELSDIIVFSLKTFAEATEEGVVEGLPSAVICLLTSACKVHVCLDLEGIVARWLPSTANQAVTAPTEELTLLVVEIIHLPVLPESSPCIPVITTDVHSDHSFFVTHSSGVFYVSMESWIRKLENELCEPQMEGAEFRSKLLFEGARTLVEHPIPFPADFRGPEPRASAMVLEDGNVGYLLLCIVGDRPICAQLDAPDHVYADEVGDLSQSVIAAGMESTQPPPPRTPYEPPKELYQESKLAAVIEEQVPARRRGSLKEEVRLSPANLELLMHVHRVLSQETNQFGQAVADLFRRCERLRDELREQIYRAAQLAVKIDGVTGDDEVPSEQESGSEVAVGAAKIEKRVSGVRDRQEKLTAQYDRIRRKLASIGPPELSEKEGQWIDEIAVMDRALQQSREPTVEDEGEVPTWQRLDELKRLKQELKKQAEEALQSAKLEHPSTTVKVPSASRKLENEQVERLLERETALVEAATQRLRSLGISVPDGAGL